MKTTPVHLPDEANLALEQLALQTGRSHVELIWGAIARSYYDESITLYLEAQLEEGDRFHPHPYGSERYPHPAR